MSVRSSKALWTGTLKEGRGTMTIGKNAWEGPYSFNSRFEEGQGTNPEELVGAAHAGCYSMFLSALISGENMVPTSISTTAHVTLEKDDVGPKISKIELHCEAEVPGITEEKLQELAAAAKEKCPISRLCAGTTIVLDIKLRA